MKVLNRDNPIHRMMGRWRLLLNQCPRCNSDAPHVDRCVVCRNVSNGLGATERNRRQQYPLTRETKALWWYCWMHAGFEGLQRSANREAQP